MTQETKCPVCGETGSKHKPGCNAPRTKSGEADLDALSKQQKSKPEVQQLEDKPVD